MQTKITLVIIYIILGIIGLGIVLVANKIEGGTVGLLIFVILLFMFYPKKS